MIVSNLVVLSSGNPMVVVSVALTVVVDVVLGVVWFCLPASWIHVSKICLIQGSDIDIESITTTNQLQYLGQGPGGTVASSGNGGNTTLPP